MVCYMKGMRWRFASCDGMYMWTRLLGVRGLLAIGRICRYGVSSKGVAIINDYSGKRQLFYGL